MLACSLRMSRLLVIAYAVGGEHVFVHCQPRALDGRWRKAYVGRPVLVEVFVVSLARRDDDVWIVDGLAIADARPAVDVRGL